MIYHAFDICHFLFPNMSKALNLALSTDSFLYCKQVSVTLVEKGF